MGGRRFSVVSVRSGNFSNMSTRARGRRSSVARVHPRGKKLPLQRRTPCAHIDDNDAQLTHILTFAIGLCVSVCAAQQRSHDSKSPTTDASARVMHAFTQWVACELWSSAAASCGALLMFELEGRVGRVFVACCKVSGRVC